MPAAPLASRSRPQEILILACGNTLRGDDGIGWHVGSILQRHPPCERLSVLFVRSLLPELADAVYLADTVVFVDCAAQGAPGTVSISAVSPAHLPQRFSHHLDPASLLQLTLELYGRIPSHRVAVTVSGELFECTGRLSERVKAAVPRTLAAVCNAFSAGRQPGSA